MIIYLGADHRGFAMKETLKSWLQTQGYQIADRGATNLNPQDDYTDFGKVVSQEVANSMGNLGVLLCHSGQGMAIAANRVKGIRAALAWNIETAVESKTHTNSNILVIPSGFVNQDTAQAMIKAWIDAKFSDESKYTRRITKIDE